MTEDQMEWTLKNKAPGSVDWIRAMKHMIGLEESRIRRLKIKVVMMDIDWEQLKSLEESKLKNLGMLKANWNF